jgi:hypothetical protein
MGTNQTIVTWPSDGISGVGRGGVMGVVDATISLVTAHWIIVTGVIIAIIVVIGVVYYGWTIGTGGSSTTTTTTTTTAPSTATYMAGQRGVTSTASLTQRGPTANPDPDASTSAEKTALMRGLM